ncbi:MAG: AbrB/MazE/SpoVT family DNA-binding domain-containing protein [Thermomicrobiales bacterium]
MAWIRQFVANINSKGQVTIPAEIRRHLGISAPGKIAFVIDDEGKVDVRPVAPTIFSLRGTLSPLVGRETVDFDDLIEEAFQEMADRVVRDIGDR